MRVLFAFAGGRGHFEPLVPIARAAKAAGHTVAFAGRAELVPAVEALGFGAVAIGPAIVPKRAPLVELDAEREDQVLREGFAGWLARLRAADVLALCGDWQPDLIVCDEVDFGSMVAGERLGIPYASMLVIAAGSFVRQGVVSDPLNALRADHGLPPDPDLAMLTRYLVLSPFPPSYRDPVFPLPATGHSIRPAALDPGASEAAPASLVGSDGVPLVYFTLGTVFNLESGDLFTRVLAGLRALPINVIVTVGPQVDPEELGPVPGDIRIDRFVPQSEVMSHCSAVVCHGGSGSVIGALSFGLPLVVIPMGADQPLNAKRCKELGVARVLDAISTTPDAVGEAVAAVLVEPTYRSAAERMRDEIAALPGPVHALSLLERLAAAKRPMLSA
jgi:UDP:flavonoid glycosyltransferase YjiC (YdhE family)